MALLVKYFGTSEAKTAAAVFSGSYLLIAVFYNLLWRHVSAGHRLLHPSHDVGSSRTIAHQYNIGFLAYVFVFAISFVSPNASIVGCLLLAVYFALPERVVRVRRNKGE